MNLSLPDKLLKFPLHGKGIQFDPFLRRKVPEDVGRSVSASSMAFLPEYSLISQNPTAC